MFYRRLFTVVFNGIDLSIPTIHIKNKFTGEIIGSIPYSDKSVNDHFELAKKLIHAKHGLTFTGCIILDSAISDIDNVINKIITYKIKKNIKLFICDNMIRYAICDGITYNGCMFLATNETETRNGLKRMHLHNIYSEYFDEAEERGKYYQTYMAQKSGRYRYEIQFSKFLTCDQHIGWLEMYEYDPIFLIRCADVSITNLMPYSNLTVEKICEFINNIDSYIELPNSHPDYSSISGITELIYKYLYLQNPKYRQIISELRTFSHTYLYAKRKETFDRYLRDIQEPIRIIATKLYKKMKTKDYTNTDEFNFICYSGIDWKICGYDIEDPNCRFDKNKLNIDVWTLYPVVNDTT